MLRNKPAPSRRWLDLAPGDPVVVIAGKDKGKTGKVKHKKAYLRHLLSSKGRSRKRHLRQPGILNAADARNTRKLVPYL